MRGWLVVALLALWPSTGWAINCAIGSYPSVVHYGNQKVCKRLQDNSVGSVQGSLNNCPIGTFPLVDTYGNRICQSTSGPKQQLYDTSKGCPIGMFPTVDMSGNQACKRF